MRNVRNCNFPNTIELKSKSNYEMIRYCRAKTNYNYKPIATYSNHINMNAIQSKSY